MKLVKLQLVTLRAFCLSLISLIDICLQEEELPKIEEEIVPGCLHQDTLRIPTMGGGEQQLCRTCGAVLTAVPPKGE